MYDSIIQSFTNTLKSLPRKGIALYGTGNMTQILLEHYHENNIVAIIDSNYPQNVLCGIPVISIEQTWLYGIKSIIIVARKSSMIIIRNQIINICSRESIQLFDIYGKNLSDMKKYFSTNHFIKYGKSPTDDAVLRVFEKAYSHWKTDKTIRQFAYTFVAPVIVSFCVQLFQYIKNNLFDKVWLLSRDGYIIKQCLDVMKNKFGCQTEFVYLLTSRKIFGDICHLQNYMKYLKRHEYEREKILIVDFVAKGTCQTKLEQLLGKEFEGYYFIFIKEEEVSSLCSPSNIRSLYSVSEYADDNSALYAAYPVLELLVSETTPSLLYFDLNIKPVYSDYKMDENIIAEIKEAQQGILSYLYTYIESVESLDASMNLKLCDNIFQKGLWEDVSNMSLFHNEYYDEYYNRKYHLPVLK